MANDWDDDNNDQNTPPALREAYDKLKKEHAKQQADLERLAAQVRQSTVKDVLTAKSIDTRIAKFIPGDVSDEAGITSWLDENADLFGFKAAPELQAQEPAQQPNDAPGNNFSALAAMAQAEIGARSIQPTDDAVQKIAGTSSIEELGALLSGMGVGVDRSQAL